MSAPSQAPHPMPQHATSCTSRRRHATGFTLTELLVVVLLVGLMAGIAGIPAVDDGGPALAQGELYVRDAIHTARARAIATRVPHGVAFDALGERLIVLAQDGTPVQDPLTKAPYLIGFLRPDMPPELTILEADFGATSAAAIFDAQGDPVTGGSVTLECRGQTLVLSLDPATGALQ